MKLRNQFIEAIEADMQETPNTLIVTNLESPNKCVLLTVMNDHSPMGEGQILPFD